MLNLLQNNDFYLLTLPCLRARSDPLCAHSVHGPLAPQGGLKSKKFQRQTPPIMFKRIQNKKIDLLALPCLCAHSNPLCANSVHRPLAPEGELKSQRYQRQTPLLMLKRIQNQQIWPPSLTVLACTQQSTIDYQMTTNDYQWLPMTTSDYQWLLMTTHDYRW